MMIKGLAITPPVIGRIAIGHMVERNGKRLPEKDDFFTITSQVQNGEGWIPHPLQTILAEQAPHGKLRAIPVTLLFNAPDLNLRAQYSLFDRSSGRPLCVGDGESARRVGNGSVQAVPCPAPESCELGRASGCKVFGRLNVRIEGQGDELGSFVFRTTGFNSIRTLAARLDYFHAASGGNLACLPLELRLRGKSTTQSHRTPIYYVDLVVRTGMTLSEALREGRAEREAREEAGLDQDALDAIAREGFGNGVFEESEEEGAALVEEFYPEAEGAPEVPTGELTPLRRGRVTARLVRSVDVGGSSVRSDGEGG